LIFCNDGFDPVAAVAELFLDRVFVVGFPLTLLVLPVSFFGGVEIYLSEVVEQSGDYGGFLVDLEGGSFRYFPTPVPRRGIYDVPTGSPIQKNLIVQK